MGWGQILGSAVGTYFGGPIGAGIGGAIGGYVDQSNANDYNSAQAAANRDFQANMSGTSYQRAMADMKAAGLNPMLAFSNGGASVPVGSQASFSSVVDSSQTSASAVSQADSASKNAQANLTNSATNAARQQVDEKLTNVTVDKVRQEITNLESDNERIKKVIDNLRIEYQILNKRDLNETEVGNQLRATVSKLMAEVPYLRSRQALLEAEKQLTDLDVAAAKDSNNLGRITKEYGPLAQILLEALRSSRRR